MWRTDAQLSDSEVLQVQQLGTLPDSAANEALAKENGVLINKEIASGWAVDSVFWRSWAVTAQSWDYNASQVWLWNVDNTSDANKPVSTAQQTEIDTKEDALGNPSTDGQILSSTAAWVRSWIDASGGWGGMTLLSTTDVTNPVSQIDTTSTIFDWTYDWYIVRWFLVWDTTWRLFVNFSNNDLSSMLTIGSMHFVARWTNTTAATSLSNVIWIINNENVSNSSEPWVWFEMKINSTTEELRVIWSSSYVDTWFSRVVLDNFSMKANTWNSMRLYQSSWNISSWFVSIYWITT